MDRRAKAALHRVSGTTGRPGRLDAGTGGRGAARGTLQMTVGRIVLFGSGWAVSTILARALGPADYGVYGVVLSVLLWLEHLGDFGIPEATAKLISEDRERAPRVERAAQTLLLLVFLLVFVLAWLAAPLMAQVLHVADGTRLFRLAILDVPLTGAYFAAQGILAGRRDFVGLSLGLAAYGLTKLAGVGVAGLAGLSVAAALVVNALGTAGALAVLAVRLSPRPVAPSLAGARPLLSLAAPVGVFLLASQVLYNLDLWSLTVLGVEPAAVVGLYVAALNLARVPALLCSSINSVILPYLSMALAGPDPAAARRYVHGAGRFLWLTLLPAAALVALTAEDVMVLVFSARYGAGARFLALQAFAFALLGFAQMFGEMLIARGDGRRLAAVALLHGPVAVAANLALVPRFGALGAAAALLLTALSLAATTGLLVRRRLGALLEPATAVNGALATAAMALAAVQAPAAVTWLPVKAAVLVGLYGAALVVLGELQWSDLRVVAPSRAGRG